MGPHGGPMGPHGAHGTHGAPWGAAASGSGAKLANVPPLGKTFFQKKYQKDRMGPKIQNVNFWVKTPNLRLEILSRTVDFPRPGDLFLTISRKSEIL